MNTEPSQQDLKAQLRRTMRQRRSAITVEERSALDDAIRRNLLAWCDQADPAVVAAFLAFDGEPDLEPALLQMAESGTRLALPVVENEPGRSVIRFREWLPGRELRANRFGIREPSRTTEIRLPQIDLVLVPLVAWDESGGRLGMGASYYDRLFQPFRELARPVRMGVGYGVQKADRLPLDPWDVRLHMMLSESGVETCRTEDSTPQDP
jgi:5-formyltetrahydrofolate cyclo-ligase